MERESRLTASSPEAGGLDSLCQKFFRNFPFGRAAVGALLTLELAVMPMAAGTDSNPPDHIEQVCVEDESGCADEPEDTLDISLSVASLPEEDIIEAPTVVEEAVMTLPQPTSTVTTIVSPSTTTTTTIPPTTTTVPPTTTTAPPITAPARPARVGCEQIVQDALAQVPVPNHWQFICQEPNGKYDGLTDYAYEYDQNGNRYLTRSIVWVYYADPDDTDAHMYCVVLHEIRHTKQVDAGEVFQYSNATLETMADNFAAGYGC